MGWFSLLFLLAGIVALMTGQAYLKGVLYKDQQPMLYKFAVTFYFFMAGFSFIVGGPMKDTPTGKGLINLVIVLGPLLMAMFLAMYTKRCLETGVTYWHSPIHRDQSPGLYKFCIAMNSFGAVACFMGGFVLVLKFLTGHRFV